ncbi:hypothetical protein UY3_15360 [Chelonia mydas]|uniref:Uncharacterized protein n=1 Tax=Chelonia mydas TaxID=8469 RepID=M7AQJ6_CHEMY|nr:hypothetical protein UY3_15360 [Chelonia mydas]
MECRNAMVRSIAANALHDATKKRIGRAASNQDTASFLSGSLDGEFGRDGGNIASLWSRTHSATRRLGKRIGCRWEWCEERQELGVLVPQIRPNDNTIVTPSTRGMLERTLKAAIHSLYMETLKRKLDQGPMPFSGTGFLWAPRDMGVVNVFGTNTCPVAQSPGQSLDLALQNRPEKLLLLWPYAEGNESIMSHSSQDTGPVEFRRLPDMATSALFLVRGLPSCSERSNVM